MLRLDRLFRATAFRITCAYLGVFTLTILLVGAAIYFGVPWVWEGRIHDDVQAEFETLIEGYNVDGAKGLAKTLSERADELADDGFIFVLQDPDGKALAGRLPVSAAIEGWQEIAAPWRDEDEPYLGMGKLLPDGHYLLLGQDAEDLQDVAEFVEEGLIWTFVFALPMALLGGVFVSGITLRRVEAINRTTRQIRGGDLSKRVPVAETDDEFDRLANQHKRDARWNRRPDSRPASGISGYRPRPAHTAYAHAAKTGIDQVHGGTDRTQQPIWSRTASGTWTSSSKLLAPFCA